MTTRRAFFGARQDRVPARAHRTLVRNTDVITMDPTIGELTGVDVLLEGGRIAAIGPDLGVVDADIVDGRNRILMPGMIDGHRHLWEGASIGVLSKISATVKTYTEWKLRTMVCYRPEDAWLAQYASAIQAIDAGVTSIVDYCHIFHTPELAEAGARGLVEAGIGGTFCYQVGHTPTYGPGQSVDYAAAWAMRNAPADAQHWATVERLRNDVFAGDTGPLRFGLATSADPTPPMRQMIDEFERIRRYQPHLISMHHQRRAPRPPEYFSALVQMQDAGLLSSDLHIAHGNGLTDEELDMMKSHGVKLCATTTGEHSYAYPSVHGRARDRGLAVGIGTDAPQAFPANYLFHARYAWYNLLQTAEGRVDAKRYGATETLDFVTRLGAAAIGEADETGVIAPGRRADLVLVDTRRIGFARYGSLAERVLNYGQLSDIDSVWIAGIARKRNGEMLGVDMIDLKHRMVRMVERINQLGDTIEFRDVPQAA